MFPPCSDGPPQCGALFLTGPHVWGRKLHVGMHRGRADTAAATSDAVTGSFHSGLVCHSPPHYDRGDPTQVLGPMEQKWRQSGLPLAPPRPCPTPGSCSPHRPPQQPTQVSAVPHLRGLQRLGELAPGTGSRLIADLLSHQGAVFKAAEVHTQP